MSTPKRVLIPTYYFPPYGTVEIFRISKFIKHLPDYGWEPYVLTVTDEHHVDTESVHEFTGVVDAVKQVDTTNIPLYGTIRKTLDIINASRSVRGNAVTGAWVPVLIRTATEIIRNENIDVVLGTGGPFLPLVALPVIKRRTGTPYVVDLRDPWVYPPGEKGSGGVVGKVREMIAKTGEPKIVRDASTVITVTELMCEQYRARYPGFTKKFRTITNGYEPATYDPIKPEPSTRFRITYPGSWYGLEHAEAFFQGFTRFVESHDAELVHYGQMETDIGELIKCLEINNVVDPRGYVAHDTVVATSKGSDVGLVISRNPNALSTKVFDFIGCDVPILAVCEPGSTLDEFVSQFDHGYTTSKDSPEEVEMTLRRIWEERPSSLGTDEQVREYTLNELTAELVDVLDKATV